MRGFTLIEMVVVTVLIAVLAALLTPIATNYIEQARLASASAECRAIGEAIQRFEKDVGRWPMFNQPLVAGIPDTSATVATLRGPGSKPTEGSVTAWTSDTPSNSDCSPCVYYSMAYQLTSNGPAYPTTSSLAKPFKWKGPYIDVDADPWGNAYLVNIIHSKSGSNFAVFVLSAGPNGAVETAYDSSASLPVTAGGDDVIFRIK